MVGSGLAALAAMTLAHALDLPGLTVSFSPLAFPSIPLVPVVGILVAAVPAIAAPRPVSPSARQGSAEAATAPPAARSSDARQASPDLSGTPA